MEHVRTTPGCPIGPIANPGDVAIDAAMHPADGDWLYFVTVNLDTGETVFTSTYSRARTYVDQWQHVVQRPPGLGVLSPHATRLAVWGDPIAHSRSPQLHAAAYRGARARLDVRAPPRRRGGVRSRARRPRRQLARPLAHDAAQGASRSRRRRSRDRRAELTGAVNTLLLDPDGPRGFNTDVGGIVARPRRRGHRPRRARARIVGAGATATSALVALSELGVARGRGRRAPPGGRRAARRARRLARHRRDRGIVRRHPITARRAAHDRDAAGRCADRGCRGRRARARAAVCCSTSCTGTGRRRSRVRVGACRTPGASGLGMLLHQALLQVRIFARGDPDCSPRG